MPAPHHSSARTASQPSILLLEEYDALAAAIGSALKKFAPQHTVSVARTLAEAEKLAAKIDPELFVVDVDPPWPGLTDFIEKMRTAYPDARALVIGTAIPAEIAAERGSFGALQFIEKPFELAAFGAAVQAVLGPWREPESANPRGSLRALSLDDVALMHCAANAKVILDVRTGTKNFGEIHIAGGQITHAQTGRLDGTEALREMLAWPEMRMSEAKPSASPRRTIQRNWSRIFLEALRTARTIQPPDVLPEKEATPEKRRPKAGKKIVVIDDTEMLLIFVEDVLATADPEFQITTALSGSEGLREIERIVPDLVLLDYSLPDFNGDEVCRRLLQNERTAQLPVLMMSGHVPEMNVAAARLENIVATIGKPFLSDALVNLVRQTLVGGSPARTKTIKPVVLTRAPVPIPPPALEPKPKLPKKAAPPPIPASVALQSQRIAPPIQQAARIATAGENQAVLGLFLEVASMQLTPQLQMGAIRTRPISFIASLHLPSSAIRNAIPAEIGFQLGTTDLDENGRISSVRLVPTAKPFQPAQTRNAFEIGGVAVIANHARARVQLTPAGSTPMTMLLVAHLELTAVDLSPTFQVAQLILKWRTNVVRITLNPKAPEQSGASFEVTVVKLDSSGRIAELLLSPLR